MLKINKILSKKIKFPLSLRGLFLFCHSRESGNPSPLSLRAKQACPCESRGSNLSGFSLIELMIAVAILALAVFGIFNAYSVGFMGMADARDRTVATNYLRETIEDFKNMNFNKVKDEPITLITGTKFHRGSIVLDLEKTGEEVTLKKVITQVRWMDRKGNIKTEEASTILYNKPNTSEVSDAVEIILYAQSYYTILPDHEVTLIAEIKDKNGNTIDWNGEITFSVITAPPNDPQVGTITTVQPADATNGVATCIFTAIGGDSVDGIEMIQASAILDVVGEVTDTVNIRVTTGAVGIILEPATEEDRIRPVGENSTIKITVVKADYETPIAYSGTITLDVSDPNIGSLPTSTINSVSADPANPTTFILTSSGTAGIAEITASATDLDMGYTEVTFTGDAKSILVSAKKSIYPGEETEITVTIVDENIQPVSYGASGDSKTVIIADNPDEYGTLNDISGTINLTFEGESSKICVFKAYTKEVLGELILPQEITITASDTLEELNSGSTNIEILSPLVAHHIDVTFDPSIIELDEEPIIPSDITAIMKSEDGDIVYGNFITFKITNGVGSFSSIAPPILETTLTGGMATATLYPYEITSTDKAFIEIYSSDLTSNPDGPPGNPDNKIVIEVLFHQESEPDRINLTADPQDIFVGGQTCTLTAKVVDGSGVTYSDYNGRVRFTITGATGSVTHSGAIDVDALNGIATLDLTSTDNEGQIFIAAETLDLNLDGYDEVFTISSTPVDIKVIELNLVDNSLYYYDNGKIVMFNINIIGPELNLESMIIVWGYDPSKISKIEIKSPYTAADYNPIINTDSEKTPYTENDINANLFPGESTIRLTFSTNMEGKSLSVTFNTNFGAYEYNKQIIVVE